MASEELIALCPRCGREMDDDVEANIECMEDRCEQVEPAERAEPAGAEFFASDVDFLDRCLNWKAMPYDVWLARCRDLRDRLRQHIAAVQPQREGEK